MIEKQKLLMSYLNNNNKIKLSQFERVLFFYFQYKSLKFFNAILKSSNSLSVYFFLNSLAFFDHSLNFSSVNFFDDYNVIRAFFYILCYILLKLDYCVLFLFVYLKHLSLYKSFLYFQINYYNISGHFFLFNLDYYY